MKNFFLVIWRIIRWIMYLILILFLPFLLTYLITFAINPSGDTVTTYKAEAFDLIELDYQLVFVKASESDLNGANTLINGNTPDFSLNFWKVSLNYVAHGDTINKIEASTDGVLVLTSGTIDDIYHFDATYFILGSLVLYVIICIIAGVRRNRKNKKKRLAAARESISSPEDLELIEEGILLEESETKEEIETEELILPVSDLEENIKDEEDYIEDDFLVEEEVVQEEKQEPEQETEEAIIEEEIDSQEFQTKWVKHLAENGDKEAQYTLAVYYSKGYKDIEQNEILARYWLEKSASQGFDKAVNAKIKNE